MDVLVPCPCPDTPHEQDTVTLRDTLGYRGAAAVRYALALLLRDKADADMPELLATASEQYIQQGIAAWTFTDAFDKPIPINNTTIAEYVIAHLDIAGPVAEEADGLYVEAVMLPLLQGGLRSSPTSQTERSTSATNGSGPKPPRRSKRSSISISQTDATATTP